MLYMKEDDMDEMMRRAAENYEVDAGKAADWNAVYAAVHESAEPHLLPAKKTKRRFAFWWLLLIPFAFLVTIEHNRHAASSNLNKDNSSVAASIKNKPVQQPVSSENIVSENKAAKKDIFIQKINSKINISNSTVPYNNQASAGQSQENNYTGFKLEAPVNNQHGYISADVKKLNSQSQAALALDNYKPSPLSQQENNLTVLNNNSLSGNADKTKNSNATVAQSSIKIKINNKHYFYAGLMAGPDLSFVKFQKMQSVGYNFGLLVGYKFNKLSLESGLLFDKKNYYTNGKNFDVSKLPYFYNSQLIFADGYCKMFEIPLNIKYDISTQKRHTWYASAGLSSYLMNKEFYNYDYIKNGQYYQGSHPYYHTTKDWFSVLNLSAGYQLQTGTNTSLRIEPYYKTTLNKVGTGNLSITSTGINVGITRRIP